MPSDLVFPTGIASLDALLGGGVPTAGNILVSGDPLCGKKPLIMQFVYEGLKMNMPGIFVLTDFGFAEWKAMMASSGWATGPFESNGLLQVIDCYSKQYDPKLVDEGIVTYVDNGDDLSEISMKLSGLQEQIIQVAENYRLGFHTLSSLLETNDNESAFRFMQFISGKFRRSGATSMYVIEKGMHDDKQVRMMESLMDGVIEFSEDKVRVRGLMGSVQSWRKYEITQGGVKIAL